MSTPATPETSASASASDPFMSKVAKYMESHNAKIRKLQDENTKLRTQISELKSVNSRVRRIPKPVAPAAITADS